jgi:hypothetical protein
MCAVAGALSSTAASSESKIPKPWQRCAQVNRLYTHGVGRVGAHDKTSSVPVTSFKRSTRLYTLAMHYNRGLDRDHDGIAYEKV